MRSGLSSTGGSFHDGGVRPVQTAGLDKCHWLITDKLSLPLNEAAGSVHMIEILPEAMNAKYSNEQEILVNIEKVTDVKKPFKKAEEEEYRKPVQTLTKHGVRELRG